MGLGCCLKGGILKKLENKTMKKIYISGKISDLDIDVAKDNFRRGVSMVELMGKEAVNPFDVLPFKPEYTWRDYMKADIKALMDCDGILMLPDWIHSDGATIEHNLAHSLFFEFIYTRYDGESLILDRELSTHNSFNKVDCIKEDIKNLMDEDTLTLAPHWDKFERGVILHYIAKKLQYEIIYPQ